MNEERKMGGFRQEVSVSEDDRIILADAAAQFRNQLWNGHSPVDELGDDERYSAIPSEMAKGHKDRLSQIAEIEWRGLIRPFEEGRLEAFTVKTRSCDTPSISEAAWQNVSFPERLFMAPSIEKGNGEFWDALAGLPLFTERVPFEAWLEKYMSASRALCRNIDGPRGGLRDFMIGLANDGLANSSELEEMAARWGLPSISSQPDTSDFDPINLATWTLPMTIAWVVWRTVDEVRNHWDEYRAECRDWHNYRTKLPCNGGLNWIEVDGEELRNRNPSSLGNLSMMEAISLVTLNERHKLMSVKSAREALWKHLTEGAIHASGVNRCGDIVEIPSHEWAHLEVAHNHRGTDYLINRHQPFALVYEKLAFPRASVMAIWKPRKPKLNGCSKYLEDMMRLSPSTRPRPRPEIENYCKEKFGVGERRFDKLWKKALEKVPQAKASWTAPGRPRKSPTNKSPH